DVCSSDLDPKIDMWHVDVIDHRGRFVAIFSSSDRNQSGSGTNGKLFYAESFDGKQWNMAPTPFLEQGTAGQWDDDKLYRSSAVPTSTGERKSTRLSCSHGKSAYAVFCCK